MLRLALPLLLIGPLATPAQAQQQRVDPTWLSFDPAAKTARFHLIAGLTGLNGALNFNGFRDGELEMVTTGPVGRPLGEDDSGFRLVQVRPEGIEHEYVSLGRIPTRLDGEPSP